MNEPEEPYEHYPIRVGPSPLGGRGVFATRDIKEGEVVERCPVVPIFPDEARHCHRIMAVANYWFAYELRDEGGQLLVSGAIALGYGGLYNHSSEDPNIVHDSDDPSLTMTFTATRDIKKGEELVLDYKWSPEGAAIRLRPTDNLLRHLDVTNVEGEQASADASRQ